MNQGLNQGSNQGRRGTGGRGQHSSYDTGTAVVDEVAESLGVLARDLEEVGDAGRLLDAVVRAAVAMVPGAEEGSISVVRAHRRVRAEAPTSDLPRRVDALQEEVRQGPCLDATYQQQTVRVRDMATEERWPLFAARAAAEGVGSMLSLQLYVEGDNLGALNLYARTPHAFDDESEQIGLLVAAHAAVAFVGARKAATLARALVSRDLIGQAKGILMERHGIDGDRAFLLLTTISQNSNRRLPEVALELVDGGTVAGADDRPRPLPRRPAGGAV